jgi:hypothetical protein
LREWRRALLLAAGATGRPSPLRQPAVWEQNWAEMSITWATLFLHGPLLARTNIARLSLSLFTMFCLLQPVGRWALGVGRSSFTAVGMRRSRSGAKLAAAPEISCGGDEQTSPPSARGRSNKHRAVKLVSLRPGRHGGARAHWRRGARGESGSHRMRAGTRRGLAHTGPHGCGSSGGHRHLCRQLCRRNTVRGTAPFAVASRHIQAEEA